jgi:hypothetical protein
MLAEFQWRDPCSRPFTVTNPASLLLPRALLCAVPLLLAGPMTAFAQSAAPAPSASDASAQASGGAPASADDDDDAVLQPAEPDFRLINTPTTLRVPLYKSNFTLTHRFAGNLRQGDFGDQASSLFGLDDGAVIGLEYRLAVARHVEAVVYRSSFDKTFQFYGKYDAIHQGRSTPISVSALVSVEGANNFKQDRAPALGVVVSRTIDDAVALYASPIWVHNTAPSLGVVRDTVYAGLGGRVRIRPTVYVVGEVSPRLAGYRPDQPEFGFGIEKRAGGHLFQLNFTNTFGTTFGQVARGGVPQSLYLGFNLSRKFF